MPSRSRAILRAMLFFDSLLFQDEILSELSDHVIRSSKTFEPKRPADGKRVFRWDTIPEGE